MSRWALKLKGVNLVNCPPGICRPLTSENEGGVTEEGGGVTEEGGGVIRRREIQLKVDVS